MRAAILFLAVPLAALIAVAHHPAYAQREKQPYCLQNATGALNCTYDSLDQCQQILGGHSVSGTCIANPARLETTGSGGTRSPDRPPGGRDQPPSTARGCTTCVKPRVPRIRNRPACCRCRHAAARSSSRTFRARPPDASSFG